MKVSRVIVTIACVAYAPGVCAQSPPRTAAARAPELVLQTGHTAPVGAVALSRDGRVLVSASDDATVKIWDTSSGAVLRTLFGHDKAVLAVALTADAQLLASADASGAVRLWTVATGEGRQLGSHAGFVRQLAFSSDGRQLTSLGNTELKVWDVPAGRELRTTKFDEDKKAPGRSAAGVLGARYDDTAAALSADGRLAALGGGTTMSSGVLGYGGGVRTKPIRVYDARSGREIETLKLKGELPAPRDLAFSPDGRLLAAKFIVQRAKNGPQESAVSIFDVSTGQEVKTLPGGDFVASGGLAFSPDGRLLASRIASMPSASPAPAALPSITPLGSIRLIDVATWRDVRELKDAGFELVGVTGSPLRFSGDGRLIAASLHDGIALIDVSSGARVRVLETAARASAVDTAQAAAEPANPYADRMKQIQDMLRSRTGALGGFGVVAIGGGAVSTPSSSLAFTPDGKLLLAAGTTAVWDLRAGTPRRLPQRSNMLDAFFPGASATPGAISEDGTLTATSGGLASPGVVVTNTATGEIVQRISVGTAPAQGKTPAPFTLAPQILAVAFGAAGPVIHYCESKNGGSRMKISVEQECRIATFDRVSGKPLRDAKLETARGALMGVGAASTLSRDGRYLATMVIEGGGRGDRADFKLTILDVSNGAKKLWDTTITSDDRMAAPRVTFNPAANVLAVAAKEKDRPALRLYDTASGRQISTIASIPHAIASLAFSRDGKSLAATFGDARDGATTAAPASGDTVVTIWDVAAGREAFTLTHDSAVTGVAFAPAGGLIATLGRDKNQYLWDARTGDKVATLVNLDVLNRGDSANEWLIVTPDGLFDGSPAAWQQINWRFSQNTFDVGPVEIFFNELYYPGLAGEIFAGRRPRAPRGLQQLDRRQPIVAVAAASRAAAGDETARTMALKVEVAEAAATAGQAKGSGARDVRLFRNGTLVHRWAGDVLNGRPKVTLDATVPLVAGDNRFTAYAFNDDNVKSTDALLAVTGSAALARKGVAHVIAVGVNQYANAQYNLKYAAADAQAFAREVKTQQEKLAAFERVEVTELVDAQATKENVLAAIAKMRGAQPEDAVIVYFAGHGTAKGPRFYLVPHDLGYAGPRAGVDAAAVDMILTHSISDEDIERAMEGVDAGKLLMVIDACNSGQALEAEERRRGPMNSKGLAQLAYEKGMFILTAAQSYQAALEAAQLGHGYLTYTLIDEGLGKALADRDAKDGQITVREWFDYATERVPEMQQQNTGTRLLLEIDDKATSVDTVRNLQRPRAFYRRESIPVVIARP